jgi:L-ascorbate metabolism protein UlaG (beta-lactamase superfamily)
MVASNITLTLIGGPTALIEIGSLRLLTDPTFDPPRGYQKGAVHYEKISGPALIDGGDRRGGCGVAQPRSTFRQSR